MHNLPIIRLEVGRMKHSICTALSDYAVQLDSDIKNAVEAFCTAENLQHIVSQEVNRVLEIAIKEEVEKFFRYGEGRKTVASAVKESILRKETFTVLDET